MATNLTFPFEWEPYDITFGIKFAWNDLLNQVGEYLQDPTVLVLAGLPVGVVILMTVSCMLLFDLVLILDLTFGVLSFVCSTLKSVSSTTLGWVKIVCRFLVGLSIGVVVAAVTLILTRPVSKFVSTLIVLSIDHAQMMLMEEMERALTHMEPFAYDLVDKASDVGRYMNRFAGNVAVFLVETLGRVVFVVGFFLLKEIELGNYYHDGIELINEIVQLDTERLAAATLAVALFVAAYQVVMQQRAKRMANNEKTASLLHVEPVSKEVTFDERLSPPRAVDAKDDSWGTPFHTPKPFPDTPCEQDEYRDCTSSVKPSVSVIDLTSHEDSFLTPRTTQPDDNEMENVLMPPPSLMHLRLTREDLKVGTQVTVLGENRVGLKFRRGGVGKIKRVNVDGTIDVKYAIEGGTDAKVNLDNVVLGSHPNAYGVNMATSKQAAAAFLLRGATDTLASRRRSSPGLSDVSNTPSPQAAITAKKKPLYGKLTLAAVDTSRPGVRTRRTAVVESQ